jgi:replicative DNA helicase
VNDRDDDLPPHDINAERACLSAMMQNSQAIAEAADTVTEEMFFRPAHQVIFTSLVQMFAAQVPVDPVTLDAWIRENGESRVLGPTNTGAAAVFLTELQYEAPHAATAGHYAKIVFTKAIRRRMLQQATALERAAWDDAEDASEVIARADSAMTPLRDAISGQRAAAVLSLAEFITQESKNNTPVIPKLLDHQDRVIVVAGEGMGKSMLAHQVGFCAAAGVQPFIWSESIPPVRVLIIDLETPLGLLQRRLHMMGGRAGQYPGWDEDRMHVFHRPGGINLGSAQEAFLLAEVIRRVEPDLIVGGPLYKAVNASDPKSGLAAHAQVCRFFDVIRERHGCALWLEAHAPLGTNGDPREMRPEGSNVYLKWPEYGLALKKASKAHGGDQAIDVGTFRGHREEGRRWPVRLTRDTSLGGWPWKATFPVGMFKP